MTYPTADDPLTEKVWVIMQGYHGYKNRIDRNSLTFIVFGRNGKSYDRKLRDALSQLPVVHDDGYFVPTSKREAKPYISAMRSRQASIGQRLRVLDEYLRQHQEPVKVEQMQLLEVR